MEKSLRWFKMRTVKNYVGIILCACVIIFIYKTFDISLFSNILSAFIPLIVGAILAYFLQPLVYKFEMFLDSFQNKKLIKYSHTISSIFVFVVFVLIIVVLMIAIIPALVNYVVNIADNLTLYIKNFEKTLETYLGSNLASEVIIKIDEMVVKYVNSIEAIDPIATLGTLFKAGSTIITAVLGLIFTPYVLIEAKKLVGIFDRLCSLFMSKEKIELIHDYAVRSHRIFGQFIYGKFLDSLMVKFSSLGDGGIVWIAISFLLICYKKYRQAGILILVGLIMGVLIGNCLLKNIICRPRPCWINRAVSLLIPIPYDYSFPSCHTMSSFIAAAVLLHTDIMFAYPAFLLASVIAFSRLYLYVHYPSDIIGGIALGTIIAHFVCLL